MQGRRLLTSLVKNIVHSRKPPYCPKCNPQPWPLLVSTDCVGRQLDRPIVFETIALIKRLSPREKRKFGIIFSELLGLPKPPEETKTAGDKFVVKFVVKFVNYDKDRVRHVCNAVAWVISTDAVLKSLNELSPAPVMAIVKNIPSVMKQGVSKEEADKIIAKIEAAGGVAVMEPLME